MTGAASFGGDDGGVWRRPRAAEYVPGELAAVSTVGCR
jgi:hypothetical protein